MIASVWLLVHFRKAHAFISETSQMKMVRTKKTSETTTTLATTTKCRRTAQHGDAMAQIRREK